MGPDPTLPPLVALCNPRLARRLPGLIDSLKSHLENVQVETVEGPAAMAERARVVANEGARTLVVAGGDGTLGIVLRALVDLPLERRPALGLIPVGTFNNFARSLAIPTDVNEACRIVATGRPVPVDLGRVTSRNPPASFIFKEVVGVGIDAYAFASGLDVAGPTKIPAGALASISAVLRFRPYPVKYRFEPKHRWHHCTQLLVANTPTCAAAFPILPEARLDDGMFHVLSRTWRGRLDLLAELPRILRGRHCDLEHDKIQTASRVYVTGHSNVLLHADGEFFCRMPATIEMLPGAVRVIVAHS